MKNLIPFIIISFLLSCSQSKKLTAPPVPEKEGYIFKYRYLPNTTLHTTIKSTTETSIDMGGMNVDGVPQKSTAIATAVATTTYGDLKGNNIPFRVSYDSFDLKIEGLGADNAETPSIDNMIILGHVMEQKAVLDTIMGLGDFSPGFMKSMIESGFKAAEIAFPDYELMLNDSFDIEVPIDIPIPGADSQALNMNTIYFLRGVVNDIARFDIKISGGGTMDISGMSVDMDISGGGFMDYHMKDNYTLSSVIKNINETSMDMQGMKMRNTSNSTVEITCKRSSSN